MANKSRFKRWRLRRDLTQTQIAEMTGYTQTAVSTWDQGAVPHPDKRQAIADALGATIDDLFEVGRRCAA